MPEIQRKKKETIQTPEWIKNWFAERGAEVIRFENRKIFFTCLKCGGEASVYAFSHIRTFERQVGAYHFQCKACYRKIALQKKMEVMQDVYTNKFAQKQKEMKQLFKEEGSEFISEYKGMNGAVTLRCKQCGQIDSFYALYQALSTPNRFLCKKCQFKERGAELGKQQRIYTQEFLQTILPELNIKLLNYNEENYTFTVLCNTCKKNEIFVKKPKKFFNRKKVKAVCKSCLTERRSKKLQIQKEVAAKWLKEKGSELISFTKGTALVTFKCVGCGEPGSYHTFSAMKISNERCYCAQCSFESRIGENAYNYNPELTEEDRQRRSANPLYYPWLRNIDGISNLVCRISGEKEGSGHRHHLFSYAEYPALRFSIWNGVYLSKELHNEFHSIYGNKDFTYYDFKEFFYKKTNKVFYPVQTDSLIVDITSADVLEKKKKFHATKINYIPLLEEELVDKAEQINSLVSIALGIGVTRLHARKLQIKELDKQEASLFFTENHRQGNYSAEVNIGLINRDTQEIVAAMSFAKPRFNKEYQYELIRFCSKLYHVIPGAASKLFKCFVKKHQHTSIISYCDIRFSSFDSDKTVYKRLGFTLSHTSKPNYYYIKEGEIHSRIKFQKHKLSKLLPVFDPSLSEKENMLRNGYIIYEDCGNFVFTYRTEAIS